MCRPHRRFAARERHSIPRPVAILAAKLDAYGLPAWAPLKLVANDITACSVIVALIAGQLPVPEAFSEPGWPGATAGDADVVYTASSITYVVLAHTEELPLQVPVRAATREQIVHMSDQPLNFTIFAAFWIRGTFQQAPINHVVAVEPHAVRAVLVGQLTIVAL